ncbi:Rpn family recombination-promoting nuclease/putative transposase [candidate division KSB1 bacterium]|nr:Rpn family recombination-promoting nuclease/putative transposase [candidate division KSB1 bacterium]MBL7095573.1 Rpn family recombination-promoting nuclease/putative transposase [candidate division KSB1 bacterium]
MCWRKNCKNNTLAVRAEKFSSLILREPYPFSIYLDKDSFVEKELQPFFSDIIFNLKLNNKPSILYILFEHKSQPEKVKQVFDEKNLKRGGDFVKSTAEILMEQGFENWIEQGIEKGVEQNQKMIITSMSGEGLSVEQIHKLTKIPLQKSIEILDDHKN